MRVLLAYAAWNQVKPRALMGAYRLCQWYHPRAAAQISTSKTENLSEANLQRRHALRAGGVMSVDAVLFSNLGYERDKPLRETHVFTTWPVHEPEVSCKGVYVIVHLIWDSFFYVIGIMSRIINKSWSHKFSRLSWPESNENRSCMKVGYNWLKD